MNILLHVDGEVKVHIVKLNELYYYMVRISYVIHNIYIIIYYCIYYIYAYICMYVYIVWGQRVWRSIIERNRDRRNAC